MKSQKLKWVALHLAGDLFAQSDPKKWFSDFLDLALDGQLRTRSLQIEVSEFDSKLILSWDKVVSWRLGEKCDNEDMEEFYATDTDESNLIKKLSSEDWEAVSAAVPVFRGNVLFKKIGNILLIAKNPVARATKFECELGVDFWNGVDVDPLPTSGSTMEFSTPLTSVVYPRASRFAKTVDAPQRDRDRSVPAQWTITKYIHVQVLREDLECIVGTCAKPGKTGRPRVYDRELAYSALEKALRKTPGANDAALTRILQEFWDERSGPSNGPSPSTLGRTIKEFREAGARSAILAPIAT